MIKQMDELVTSLSAARRRARRVMRYWIRTFVMMALAITMPVWAIPYKIWRRR